MAGLGNIIAGGLIAGASLAKQAMDKRKQQEQQAATLPAAQAAPQAPTGPADMSVLRPATAGTIGRDRSAWPSTMINARGDSFLTARFEGLDPFDSGLARVRVGGVGAPIQLIDVGAKGMSPAERQVLAGQLEAAQGRAPLMVRYQPDLRDPRKTLAILYEVTGGNAQAIRVKEVGPAHGPGEQKSIMDQAVFKRALESVEKDIAAMKLDRAPRIRPGQPAGEWLDSGVNSSIVQTISQLQAKGYPYEFGAKSDLTGAMDCSGFVGAVMRRVGRNMDESTGKHLFDHLPGGGATAASMIEAARQNGGAISTQELLRNPRPGCMIGLATHPTPAWAAGRPNGVDHVAMTFKDVDGKFKVAEYTPNKSGGPGLRVSDLGEWVHHYEQKGAGVFVASPEGMCDKKVLASLGGRMAALEVPQDVQVADAEEQHQGQGQDHEYQAPTMSM